MLVSFKRRAALSRVAPATTPVRKDRREVRVHFVGISVAVSFAQVSIMPTVKFHEQFHHLPSFAWYDSQVLYSRESRHRLPKHRHCHNSMRLAGEIRICGISRILQCIQLPLQAVIISASENVPIARMRQAYAQREIC